MVETDSCCRRNIIIPNGLKPCRGPEIHPHSGITLNPFQSCSPFNCPSVQRSFIHSSASACQRFTICTASPVPGWGFSYFTKREWAGNTIPTRNTSGGSMTALIKKQIISALHDQATAVSRRRIPSKAVKQPIPGISRVRLDGSGVEIENVPFWPVFNKGLALMSFPVISRE